MFFLYSYLKIGFVPLGSEIFSFFGKKRKPGFLPVFLSLGFSRFWALLVGSDSLRFFGDIQTGVFAPRIRKRKFQNTASHFRRSMNFSACWNVWNRS